MAELIARNQSRTSIQAVIDYVEDAEFPNRNYVQVHNRHQYLLDQWTAFKESSNSLRAEAQDEQEEQAHAATFVEIEGLYLETKSILELRLNAIVEADNAANAHIQQEPVQAVPQEPREIVVRIDQPKRDIENTWGEFNGNLTKWRAFCDLFTDRVHNDDTLAPANKFRLLKNSLKGHAAASLGDWELSDGNYAEAWSRLKELYEQTYLTGSKLVQRLTSLPKLDKATGAGIQKMSNIGSEVFRQLRALKYPTENVDFMFIFMLHDRLDDDTAIKWNLERTSEFPKLSEFLGFLDRHARALTTIQSETKKSSGSNEERKRIVVAEQAKFNVKRAKFDNESKQSESPKCAMCQESHTIYKCAKFLGLNLSKRGQFVKVNDLCLNCLKSGHLAKDCRGKECIRCNVKHSSYLCKENPLNKQSASTPAKAQTVTRSGRKSKPTNASSNTTDANDQY